MIKRIILLISLVYCLWPLQNVEAVSVYIEDQTAYETYLTALTNYQTQNESYRKARNSWKEFRQKHKNLTDTTTSQIAFEEGRNYALKSVMALRSYLQLFRSRIEGIADLGTETKTTVLEQLDLEILWLSNKVEALQTIAPDFALLQEVARELNTHQKQIRLTVTASINTIKLDRLDSWLTTFSELSAALNLAYNAQKGILPLQQQTSLKAALQALETTYTEIQISLEALQTSLSNPAEQNLPSLSGQLVALDEKVVQLQRRTSRIAESLYSTGSAGPDDSSDAQI